MPINIGLVLALKRSVRSKELITLLINLGHSVGYNVILRIDTTWAAGNLETYDGYSTVPTNRENIFTQAASDNGGYGQENNSQRLNNTILYQYPEPSGSYAHNTIPCRATKTLH